MECCSKPRQPLGNPGLLGPVLSQPVFRFPRIIVQGWFRLAAIYAILIPITNLHSLEDPVLAEPCMDGEDVLDHRVDATHSTKIAHQLDVDGESLRQRPKVSRPLACLSLVAVGWSAVDVIIQR